MVYVTQVPGCKKSILLQICLDKEKVEKEVTPLFPKCV